jgi:hypothetical protein
VVVKKQKEVEISSICIPYFYKQHPNSLIGHISWWCFQGHVKFSHFFIAR